MADYPVTGKRTRPPVHPGRLLRNTVLPALGIGISAAAGAMGISRQQLHKITRAKDPAAISTEMAVRLGALCSNGPDIWVNMQRNYDLWHAVRKVDVQPIIKARKALARAKSSTKQAA